jgi:hypothetical protein
VDGDDAVFRLQRPFLESLGGDGLRALIAAEGGAAEVAAVLQPVGVQGVVVGRRGLE